MTFGGWAFMIVSLSFVCGLTGWCFYKVMVVPEAPEAPPASLGG
jgi:hypothetical protein